MTSTVPTAQRLSLRRNMENLPIDTSHPAVREYLSLVRLQVLTPLSLLINIATVSICSVVTRPTIGDVIESKITALSPYPPVLAAYVTILFLGQIGYCVMLVMASTRETKHALIKGVGMSLVAANFVMAFWAVNWIMQWFLIASILQGVMLLLLVYSNLALYIYHPATSEHPLDAAFIYAPICSFVVLTLMLMFPYGLFVTLNLTRDLTSPEPWYAWIALGIVIGTNIFALLMELFQRDIVWCVAATWICVSLWSQRPKPVSVYATSIAFTVIHPIALLSAVIYARYGRRTQEHVALPRVDEHPGLYGTARADDRSAEHAGQEYLVQEGTTTTDPSGQNATIWG